MAWLGDQRHDEIKTMLQSNAVTTISVKAILNDSREIILARLASLDNTLATIASGIDQYREIAQIAYPSTALSTQAMAVLEQFYDSGALCFLRETKQLACVLNVVRCRVCSVLAQGGYFASIRYQ